MELISCPICQHEVRASYDECPSCGENLRLHRPAPEDRRPRLLRTASALFAPLERVHTIPSQSGGAWALFAEQRVNKLTQRD